MSKVIRLNQIKIKIGDNRGLEGELKRQLKLSMDDKLSFSIVRRSIDARKKPLLYYVYTLDVLEIIKRGKKIDLEKFNLSKIKNASLHENIIFEFPSAGLKNKNISLKEADRPVVVGFGPAGMFAALMLARAGMAPIVFERGDSVDIRDKKVEHFWQTGELDAESNVQFGEGGAGTFSDGKLNTSIKDPTGRIAYVLRNFVKFGADEKILYVNKPHVGTDVLKKVVKGIREEILELGGQIHFATKVEKILVESGQVKGILTRDRQTGQLTDREASNVVFAIGHSSRDTLEMLERENFLMEAKPFACGVRIEHKQSLIDYNEYGLEDRSRFEGAKLEAADYKLTYQTNEGRGVYSFCMCPGGYVVNSSSEPGRLAVNGMSYSDRASINANSALIVTVGPDDFGHGVLDGVRFQRKLEEAAFEAGEGKIPNQLFGDFKEGKVSTSYGQVKPMTKGQSNFADLNKIMPDFMAQSLKEAIEGFGRKIKGYNTDEAILSGLESRTSSPVRILRDKDSYEASIKGFFPCGEGAGYAGGITSAAIDGIRVAEAILSKMTKE